MYFENVLSYPATLINDISLMNLSNHLTDLLYISSYPILQFRLVLFAQSPFKIINVSIFLFRLQTPSVNSRSVWDCKGRNLFSISKLFCKTFFFFPQQHKTPESNTNL
jgi:hypothetical protein